LNVDKKSIGNRHQHWSNSCHHVATQTYYVCTQWRPHANWQDTIQTTHKIGKTTLPCKQSLFVLWKTRPHNWCLSKEMCSSCNTHHNFYHYLRARREGKQRHLVSIGTVRLDFDASCIQNNLALSLEPATCFLLPITIKGGKSTNGANPSTS